MLQMGNVSTIIVANLILPCSIVYADQNAASVMTKNGEIEGESIKLANNKMEYSFRGIPYAQQADQYFKKPEPPTPWKGVLRATSWPSRCIPYGEFGEMRGSSNETDSLDCLYLNVFSPSKPSVDQPNGYAVMVFMHGGCWTIGSSQYYLTATELVTNDVIVVTVNYRLGFWGFFSTGDAVAPGNWGLWDQRAALVWVHENIASFGGDPKRVTVFGESAGGVAASLHTISPHSYDYVQQGIMMSGSPLSSWLFNHRNQVVKHSQRLAKFAGCDKESSEATVACLRAKSVQQLMDARAMFPEPFLDLTKPDIAEFYPVYDGDFFPQPIEELLENAPPRPSIIGTTGLEAWFIVVLPPFSGDQQKIDSFDLSTFRKYLKLLVQEEQFSNIALVRRVVEHHYTKDGDEKNSTFLMRQLMELVGDLWLYADAQKEADIRSKTMPTWLYSFDYYNPNTSPEGSLVRQFPGARHLTDLTYLFEKSFMEPYEFDSSDVMALDVMVQLFTNFAKYGTPTPKTIQNVWWESVTASAPSHYLSIKLPLSMQPVYHRAGVALWNKLVPQLQSLGNRATAHHEL